MADIILTGKVKTIHKAMMVKSNDGGQIETISFDLMVTRNGKRSSNADPNKQYKNDFYRCTLWGKQAINFFNCTNQGTLTDRIITVNGNLTQESYATTGEVCIDHTNPLHNLLFQYGNAGMGITYDRQKNTFTIMGGYMQRCSNIKVNSFNFQDYVDNQQPTGFNNQGQGNQFNGGFAGNNQGGNWGGQSNGWNNQGGNSWNGQSNGNGFNANAGFSGQSNGGFNQQSQGNNGFTPQQNQGFQQQNNGFSPESNQGQNNGFVVEQDNANNQQTASFATCNQASTGFNAVDTDLPPANAGPAFKPSDDEEEEQAF